MKQKGIAEGLGSIQAEDNSIRIISSYDLGEAQSEMPPNEGKCHILCPQRVMGKISRGRPKEATMSIFQIITQLKCVI